MRAIKISVNSHKIYKTRQIRIQQPLLFGHIFFAGRGRHGLKLLSVIVEEVFDGRLAKRRVNTGSEVSTVFEMRCLKKKKKRKITSDLIRLVRFEHMFSWW